MTFHSESTPIARKDHRCDECRGFIRAGEKYHKHAGIFDGDFVSSKHCPVCDEIFNVIFSRMDAYEKADGIRYGEVLDWIENYDDYDELLDKYINNMSSRGVPVPDWMSHKLQRLRETSNNQQTEGE